MLENLAQEEEKEKKMKKMKKKMEEYSQNKHKSDGSNFEEEQCAKISLSDLEKGIIIDTNNPKNLLEDEELFEEEILKN